MSVCRRNSIINTLETGLFNRRFWARADRNKAGANMKLKDFRSAVIQAQCELEAAELGMLDARQKVKTAKAKTQQAKLEHKRTRKAAKEAKRLALEAEDRVRERGRMLAKAEKRLAKALKKAEPVQPAARKPLIRLAVAPKRPSARKAAASSLASKKTQARPAETQKAPRPVVNIRPSQPDIPIMSPIQAV
jgi:predicted  nucleic acid-binding Zn-ribbon protein